jgi:hypothetical protein
MIEDQVDPGRPRLNRDLGIDVEPADVTVRHSLPQTSQQPAVDGAGQARRPVLLLRFRACADWQRDNRQRGHDRSCAEAGTTSNSHD